jgi:hypothetical protein
LLLIFFRMSGIPFLRGPRSALRAPPGPLAAASWPLAVPLARRRGRLAQA